MENAIVSLFLISLMLVGAGLMVMSSFSSVDMITSAWKEMENKMRQLIQTSIEGVSATAQSATWVDINIMNNGGISLADFDRWDVIIRYAGGNVVWLPYTAGTPGWQVSGIYFDGNAEVFGPNALDPMEDMVLALSLGSPLSGNTTNWVSVSTPNGISTSLMFEYTTP